MYAYMHESVRPNGLEDVLQPCESCIYIRMIMYVCVMCVCVFMHTCMYVCIHASVLIRERERERKQQFIHRKNHVQVHSRAHTYTQTYVHAILESYAAERRSYEFNTHTRTHTRTSACTLTYTYTYITKSCRHRNQRGQRARFLAYFAHIHIHSVPYSLLRLRVFKRQM
jgi:hypothetical protein